MVCFQSTPTSVGRSLSGFLVAAIGTAAGGDCQIGNWHVNCQHSSYF